jgi:hypothetical protein
LRNSIVELAGKPLALLERGCLVRLLVELCVLNCKRRTLRERRKKPPFCV